MSTHPTSQYEVRVTTDASGGRYPDSLIKRTTRRLESAMRSAERLTRSGRPAFVRRASDGKALCPDGQWA